MSGHTITLNIDDGSTWFTIECSYDKADTERPCWEHYEDGVKAKDCDYCVYESWVEECGADVIVKRNVTFNATVEWVAESPQFTLGEVVS